MKKATAWIMALGRFSLNVYIFLSAAMFTGGIVIGAALAMAG